MSERETESMNMRCCCLIIGDTYSRLCSNEDPLVPIKGPN